MKIEKYSFGIGDRFTKEGEAQLEAIQEINKMGVPVVPVWNKSYREHKIIHTTHASVRKEADDAVAAKGWKNSYYVDADHIGLETVDEFMDYSDFFTIDVAHFISKPVDTASKEDFVKRHGKYIGALTIPGIEDTFEVTKEFLEKTADKYLLAIKEVGKIYSYIVSKKGKDNIIPEVSMDETDEAQSPLDLFFILAELKDRDIEVQTIAPKFTGLFAKGVDYIGDLSQFEKEFDQDVAVVKYAIDVLGMPSSLKLSVHSGSDKFSIYTCIKKSIKKFNAGIHVKTAGTTWLEEIIGLAKAGGKGLVIAKKVYSRSLDRYDELAGPYATVLNINKSGLPSAEEVNSWTSQQFADSLIHDQSNADYNPNFRQLIHVGYKIAVEMGDEFTNALDEFRSVIAENVKLNILERHLKGLFL
jgi:tagaturonate epimerase